VTVSFEEARACVLGEVPPSGLTETVALGEAAGRILAESVAADRDYPPFPRSARDGFAVRAADLPGTLRIIGEVRAGEVFAGEGTTGEAVEIMTGAPVPDGFDSVVMVEQTTRQGDRVRIDRSTNPTDNITTKGSEAAAHTRLLSPGYKIGFAEIALLAMVGHSSVTVFRRPRVAIIPTGDELVEVSENPLPHQIRNSNAASLAAQVARAGGIPCMMPIARDNYTSTLELVQEGLRCDLLLLSGGVSAGKYDIVERVLGDLGAHFFFDHVRIQPGQPLVFGRVREKFFFGLPGNPVSTMVTFETIARAAIERWQGVENPPFPLLRARLTREFRQKTGLTRFLPARLSADGVEITPEVSRGSGDVPAMSRANAFLVTEPEREVWAAGEDIRVLVK
jgi:molybdopterin molybdotransferase